MKKGKTLKKGATGFELGAQALEMSVDALVQIYVETVSVMVEGIKVGKAQPAIGLINTLGYFDLLHGGAYAAPIQARPWYLPPPGTGSKYYPGDITHGLYEPGLLGWITGAGLGTTAAFQANEVLTDANVPHVFPKLLSDEAYAKIIILYNQAATTDLFTKTATGVSTLVEASTKGASELGFGAGGGGGGDIEKRLAAIEGLVAKL